MFRVPVDPKEPSFDQTYNVGFGRWLTSSKADRQEWRRRRDIAAGVAGANQRQRIADRGAHRRTAEVQDQPPLHAQPVRPPQAPQAPQPPQPGPVPAPVRLPPVARVRTPWYVRAAEWVETAASLTAVIGYLIGGVLLLAVCGVCGWILLTGR